MRLYLTSRWGHVKIEVDMADAVSKDAPKQETRRAFIGKAAVAVAGALAAVSFSTEQKEKTRPELDPVGQAKQLKKGWDTDFENARSSGAKSLNEWVASLPREQSARRSQHHWDLVRDALHNPIVAAFLDDARISEWNSIVLSPEQLTPYVERAKALKVKEEYCDYYVLRQHLSAVLQAALYFAAKGLRVAAYENALASKKPQPAPYIPSHLIDGDWGTESLNSRIEFTNALRAFLGEHNIVDVLRKDVRGDTRLNRQHLAALDYFGSSFLPIFTQNRDDLPYGVIQRTALLRLLPSEGDVEAIPKNLRARFVSCTWKHGLDKKPAASEAFRYLITRIAQAEEKMSGSAQKFTVPKNLASINPVDQHEAVLKTLISAGLKVKTGEPYEQSLLLGRNDLFTFVDFLRRHPWN
jgi:hypothetical protein